MPAMTDLPRITIVPAGAGDVNPAREMLLEYAAWLAIDLSFQEFAAEVWEFPGEYVPPSGDLLMARLDEAPVGIVAFRGLDDRRAEMKRLFVRPAGRGLGVGRLLVEHVVAAARARGYRTLVLDTLPFMDAAQRT